MALRVLPQVEVKTRYYTADEVWDMACDPANEGRNFYLIDGELFEDPMTNWTHSGLAGLITFYLIQFVLPRGLGEVKPELGVGESDDSDTLLVPDISYFSHERVPYPVPRTYTKSMPDIAIEIKSPSNTYVGLHRKAETYLRHGSQIVWLVLPERGGVEEWTLDDDGRMQSRFIDRNSALDGGRALPGFSLPLSQLFPQQQEGD